MVILRVPGAVPHAQKPQEGQPCKIVPLEPFFCHQILEPRFLHGFFAALWEDSRGQIQEVDVAARQLRSTVTNPQQTGGVNNESVFGAGLQNGGNAESGFRPQTEREHGLMLKFHDMDL